MRRSDYAVLAVVMFILMTVWAVDLNSTDATAMAACAVIEIVVLAACAIYIFGQGRLWE